MARFGFFLALVVLVSNQVVFADIPCSSYREELLSQLKGQVEKTFQESIDGALSAVYSKAGIKLEPNEIEFKFNVTFKVSESAENFEYYTFGSGSISDIKVTIAPTHTFYLKINENIGIDYFDPRTSYFRIQRNATPVFDPFGDQIGWECKVSLADFNYRPYGKYDLVNRSNDKTVETTDISGPSNPLGKVSIPLLAR